MEQARRETADQRACPVAPLIARLGMDDDVTKPVRVDALVQPLDAVHARKDA